MGPVRPDPARPLEDQKWKDALAKSKQWGVPAGRHRTRRPPQRPAGAAKLSAFYAHALAAGMPFVLYFDSPADKGWVMGDRLRTTWRALVTDPRTVTPNA